MDDTANPWRTAPVLTGRHVVLRPMVDADREELRRAAADQEGWEDVFSVVPTAETEEAWFARAWSQAAVGRAMPFTVHKAGGGIVGATRLQRMSEPDLRVEIGTSFLAASVRRTGANTESKRLLLGYAFEVLRCNVVEIRTDWFHLRSQQAIERLGARRDGVLRRHKLLPSGLVRDTVVYSITAEEWPPVRTNLDFKLARRG